MRDSCKQAGKFDGVYCIGTHPQTHPHVEPESAALFLKLIDFGGDNAGGDRMNEPVLRALQFGNGFRLDITSPTVSTSAFLETDMF
jgi:hypothetical protein